MYKALFIDWDDTLGDWSASAIAAQRDIYEKYNIAEFYSSFEAWYEAYHAHNAELWERYGRDEITKEFLHLDRFLFPVVQALGGSDILMKSSRLREMAACMGEDFLELTNRYFALIPGVKELVELLHNHYELTIVSNGFVEVQYYKIAQSGLRDCFEHVVLSEEVGVQKPSARIYEEAIRMNNERRQRQGLEPLTKADILMIGDGYGSDIQGAKNAGIDQAWICLNDQLMADTERTATYKVRNLQEILPILGID